MTYLVNSDWLIDALNRRGSARQVLHRLSGDGLALSILSFGELYDGFLGTPDPSANRELFKDFVREYEVLNLSEEIMATFAAHRVVLRRRGEPSPDFRLLIASTAIVHDRILVTRNRRHYERVEGLRIYSTA